MPIAPEALLTVGRILLASLFVIGGIGHFFLVPVIAQAIAARGVPYPKTVLLAGSVFQVATGLCLAAGIRVLPAVIGLILFTIAATVMLLNFWDMQEPERTGALNGCLSNIAIVGGLLLAAAGAG